LYGREHEVETLLAAFDRVVASGALELVLVSGYSGIGKSSVVNELNKALVAQCGLFTVDLWGCRFDPVSSASIEADVPCPRRNCRRPANPSFSSNCSNALVVHTNAMRCTGIHSGHPGSTGRT